MKSSRNCKLTQCACSLFLIIRLLKQLCFQFINFFAVVCYFKYIALVLCDSLFGLNSIVVLLILLLLGVYSLTRKVLGRCMKQSSVGIEFWIIPIIIGFHFFWNRFCFVQRYYRSVFNVFVSFYQSSIAISFISIDHFTCVVHELFLAITFWISISIN